MARKKKEKLEIKSDGNVSLAEPNPGAILEVKESEQTDEEKAMEEAGVYVKQNCYFVAGTGIVVRLQKGPISAHRGQNGITKEQLAAIFFHTQRRGDII